MSEFRNMNSNIYDIVFDFSVSKSGGGLRRLHAYMKYFSNSKKSVLFIINPANEKLAKELKVNYYKYSRTIFSRFLRDKNISRIIAGKVKVFFSYGIPVSVKIGKINILHLSNALPFDYEKCSLSKIGLIKNILLRKIFKIHKEQNILTAESRYTLNKYIERVGWLKETFILENGFDEPGCCFEESSKYEKYAITVGTESYKRLDRAYKLFRKLKNNNDLKSLLIIGDKSKIPKNILKRKDVVVTGYLKRSLVVSLLKNSKIYITTSEIENSSNALIEGLIYSEKVALSIIPSHLEVIKAEECEFIEADGINYILASIKAIKMDSLISWEQSINKLISIIERN